MPSIVSVTELPREFRLTDKLDREYTRRFTVRFAEMNAGVSYSLFANGIPRYWAPLQTADEFDIGLRVVDIVSVQDSEDYFQHNVTVHYRSRSADPAQVSANASSASGSGGDPPNENPLLEPPKIVYGAVHDQRIITKSFDTPVKAIENSARQPFSPRPTVDHTRMSITYSRNQADYLASTLRGLWDKVNLTGFASFSARQLKFSYSTAELDYRNNKRFYRVTYYLEAKTPDWDLHIIDAGTNILVPDPADNTKKISVPAVKAGAPAGDQKLDGAGNRLAEGAAPTTLDFKAYDAFDFAILGLTGL